MPSISSPQRGEIWRVGLDPAVGSEYNKPRPAVVVSRNDMGLLPVRLVAPITGWKEDFAHWAWHVRVDPTAQNGLSKASSVDVLQLRGLDTTRFFERLGTMDDAAMVRIVKAISMVVTP